MQYKFKNDMKEKRQVMTKCMVLELELIKDIEFEAKNEDRTFSKMSEIFLKEAIRQRKEKRQQNESK